MLEFKTGTEGMGPLRPGEDIKVQPQLFNGDGLLIVTCYRGMLASPASDSGTGADDHPDQPPTAALSPRPLRLCLRHLLLGLRASAFVSPAGPLSLAGSSTPAPLPAFSGLINHSVVAGH